MSGKVTIRAIQHVQLAMPGGQEDDARAFYGEVLGLTEVPKPPDLAKRGGAWFERGEVRIHLGVEKDFQPTRKAHIGFLVDDLTIIIAECRRRGLEIVDNEPLDGFERIYVYDPFGNRLELMQPTS